MVWNIPVHMWVYIYTHIYIYALAHIAWLPAWKCASRMSVVINYNTPHSWNWVPMPRTDALNDLSRFFLIILRKFDNRHSEKWWWERMATEDSSSGRKHRRHPFSSLILTEQLMRSPFMTFCKVHISWLWSITHVFPSTLPFLQVNYSPRGHSAFEASRPANGCWFLLQIRMNWENGMKWPGLRLWGEKQMLCFQWFRRDRARFWVVSYLSTPRREAPRENYPEASEYAYPSCFP